MTPSRSREQLERERAAESGAVSTPIAPQASHAGAAVMPPAQLARTIGNHAFSTLIARRQRDGLEDHEGGMKFGFGKAELEPGEKGYTDRLAEELPELAGEELAKAYESGQHLSPVRPDFTSFDRSMRSSVAKGDAEIAKQMQLARVQEEFECRKFSANVPRANQVLMSMARLKAAKEALGVPSFMGLTADVVAGLVAAGPVIAELKNTGKAAEQNTAPKATSSLTAATDRLNSAKSNVNTSWLKLRALFERDLAGRARAEGDKRRAEVAKIEKDIALLKQAGATIDLAMTTMGVGLKGRTEDGGLRGATGGSAGGASLSQEIDGEFSWGKSTIPAGAKKVGTDAAAAIGLEIPTSASAILADIGKLYHMQELAQLQQAIAAFDRLEGTHLATAVATETWAVKEEFKVAVKELGDEVRNCQAARAQRLTDYANFGKQLDETAAASAPGSAAGREAPGRGQERFKLVMYVTGLAREVLTNADAAIAGFGGDPKGSRSAAKMLADEITRWRFDVPGFESHIRVDRPNARQALRQLSNFEAAVETFHNVLDPIDRVAREVLGSATTEKAAADY